MKVVMSDKSMVTCASFRPNCSSIQKAMVDTEEFISTMKTDDLSETTKLLGHFHTVNEEVCCAIDKALVPGMGSSLNRLLSSSTGSNFNALGCAIAVQSSGQSNPRTLRTVWSLFNAGEVKVVQEGLGAGLKEHFANSRTAITNPSYTPPPPSHSHVVNN